MVKISRRLQTAAALVSEGTVLADVGTDHGYIPLYLLEQGKIKRAVAMDINKGPLARAKEHITQYGMEQYIETRLSDGVAGLQPHEVDSILIAGMGGGLVMHILKEGEAVCKAAKELILQPQSELCQVRRFLAEEGYVTEAEEMVLEDGKYYPMMRVHWEEQERSVEWQENGEELLRQETCDIYGRLLLERKHPVLREFLQKEQQIYAGILENLKKQPQTDQITLRAAEIEAALKRNREAFTYYE